MSNEIDPNHEMLQRLREGADFTALHPLLVRYRDRGFSATQVMDHLVSIRPRLGDEATDDVVCELMDIAAGWCCEPSRVW